MKPKEIRSYINKYLSEGYTLDQIKTGLLQQGVEEKKIDQFFKFIALPQTKLQYKKLNLFLVVLLVLKLITFNLPETVGLLGINPIMGIVGLFGSLGIGIGLIFFTYRYEAWAYVAAFAFAINLVISPRLLFDTQLHSIMSIYWWLLNVVILAVSLYLFLKLYPKALHLKVK